MGANRKHEYRFKYLKSDEWKTVRSEALLREDACCQICGFRDLSNDAHHIAYPDSFWDTQPYHLVILCRPCHDLAHVLLGFDGDKDHCLRRFLEVSEAIKGWMEQLKEAVPPRLVPAQIPQPRRKSVSPQQAAENEKRPISYLQETIEAVQKERDELLATWNRPMPPLHSEDTQKLDRMIRQIKEKNDQKQATRLRLVLCQLQAQRNAIKSAIGGLQPAISNKIKSSLLTIVWE